MKDTRSAGVRYRIRRYTVRLALTGFALGLLFVSMIAGFEMYTYLKAPAAYATRPCVRNQMAGNVFDRAIGLCFAEDDLLPFRLVPGSYQLTGGERITINSMGYRGDEFSVQKVPGTTRVLFLGDSFTYGYGVDDEETIPRLIEKECHARFRNVEVINAGFHGSSPMQYDLYLRKIGYSLNPDIVVVLLYVGNDLADINYNIVTQYAIDGLPEQVKDGLKSHGGQRYHTVLPGWLYAMPGLDRSVLWFRLNKNAYAYAARSRQRDITSAQEERFFIRPVAGIQCDTQQRGIRLCTWVIVGRETIDNPEGRDTSYTVVRRLLDSVHCQYTDLGPALTAHPVEEVCHAGDCHLNAAGNRIAARAGAPSIVETVAVAGGIPWDHAKGIAAADLGEGE